MASGLFVPLIVPHGIPHSAAAQRNSHSVSGALKWANGKASDDEAREQIEQLVGRAFKIPREQISVVLAPN